MIDTAGRRGLTFSVITAVDTLRLEREAYAYKLVGKNTQVPQINLHVTLT